MIKDIKRECLMFLTACIFSAILCCCRVEAGGNTEFDLMEDVESLPDESLPDIPVNNAVLLVQNPCSKGDLELVCSTGTFTAEWDYSEIMVPLGETCVLHVTPHEGYAVDKVMIDDELLEPSEDGAYFLTLENEMSELSISYMVFETPAVPDEKTADDVGNDMQDEKSGEERAADPADDFPHQSASDISYDITVSYEDKEDAQLIEMEEDNAADVTEEIEDSAPVSDMEAEIIFPSETESVPEDEDDFDLNIAPKFVEESGEMEKPKEPAKPSAKGTEVLKETETALAALPESSNGGFSESEAHPASVNMAALPEVREPDSPEWDRNLVVVFLFGAALSVLSACIVKRR